MLGRKHYRLSICRLVGFVKYWQNQKQRRAGLFTSTQSFWIVTPSLYIPRSKFIPDYVNSLWKDQHRTQRSKLQENRDRQMSRLGQCQWIGEMESTQCFFWQMSMNLKRGMFYNDLFNNNYVLSWSALYSKVKIVPTFFLADFNEFIGPFYHLNQLKRVQYEIHAF